MDTRLWLQVNLESLNGPDNADPIGVDQGVNLPIGPVNISGINDPTQNPASSTSWGHIIRQIRIPSLEPNRGQIPNRQFANPNSTDKTDLSYTNNPSKGGSRGASGHGASSPRQSPGAGDRSSSNYHQARTNEREFAEHRASIQDGHRSQTNPLPRAPDGGAYGHYAEITRLTIRYTSPIPRSLSFNGTGENPTRTQSSPITPLRTNGVTGRANGVRFETPPSDQRASGVHHTTTGDLGSMTQVSSRVDEMKRHLSPQPPSGLRVGMT
ncbi:hypothetical protein Rs2_48885 [Raphanus sativus]|nr:hypothetical protein Rs2_48885 [Raphanus sativus]